MERYPQVYGNLMSYKIYVRPTAQKIGGYASSTKTEHQKNILDVLRVLFVHGEGTTWDMARARMRKVSEIRAQEKAYRRLLVGRVDRGRHAKGIMDTGMVLGRRHPKKPYSTYRLSLHGILYGMDALDPAQKEMDSMAACYGPLLPRIFGRWDLITKALGSDAYNLKILARGLLLNNGATAYAANPIYELMEFVHIKYRRNFESITEHDLAEQISYWFYTFLMYRQGGANKMKRLFARDAQLRDWYSEFVAEAGTYYAQSVRNVKRISGVLRPERP
ncbi:MAG: hypothetical protein OXP12_02955 [Thaumarchaeota archaeon]|nr:hypothetical protein [Nitrososphaerota archaeon]MDE0265952.1 hypothetical protein [Nitrososphaerota archaeon]MDE0526317.1 hypothetical protein [Nitrososphaerota archaeon]